MVVPPCLRSPANSSISLIRLTSAASCRRRNICGGVLKGDLLISGKGLGHSRVISAAMSDFAISVKSVNYSTLPAANSSVRVEDESLAEDLVSSERRFSSGSATQQYTEASNAAWTAWEALKADKSTNLSQSEYLGVLRQLSEARDFMRCKQIFEEMKENSGCTVDSEVYSLVLNAGRRTLRSNEIRELFGDISEYNQRRGNVTNEGGSPQFRSVFINELTALVSEMKSHNLRPTAWFYEELANFLTAINQGGVLINLATAMEKRGETPSTKFYNRMLHCLPRCGLLDRASMLFNRMVLKGTADYYTFLVRASALVYVNQMDAARAVLTDMKGKFQLDTIAYNILIKSYLSQGNCEQAVHVFNQMTRDPSIAPNRITCRTFLSYFYDSANLTHSESIVSYFPTANFPETLEDYGNVIKFFARYDPPKVLEIFKQFKTTKSSSNNPAEKNQIYHALLRVLNDRQVTMDWKKTFSNLILEDHPAIEASNANNEASNINPALISPDLPYQFKMIIERIREPDSVTYEIVLKKLIQMRRFDSIKALYQSMFSPENPHMVTVQPVHRNLNLTALIMSGSLQEAREFLSEMHNRRIPISGKNTILLEEAGIELPRGALTAKKGQGVTANFNNNSNNNNNNNGNYNRKSRNEQQQQQLNMNII
jgi:pentatricopeptide repeat protein